MAKRTYFDLKSLPIRVQIADEPVDMQALTDALEQLICQLDKSEAAPTAVALDITAASVSEPARARDAIPTESSSLRARAASRAGSAVNG